VIGVLTVSVAWPWGDLTDHTHWAKVGWVPFVSAPVRILDTALNLVLFVPLGAACALAARRPVLVAGLVAFGLSLGVEGAQLFSHGRFPSATDLTCNTLGALLAARVIQRGKSDAA
jgi:glycopeptide antibiotics resistance protein